MQWTLDTTHSDVEFAVKHLMISTVKGRFRTFSGSGTTDAAGKLQAVRMEIDTASVDSNVAQRDDHLRSADFFDVERHPSMVFESTRVTQSGADVTVEGTLTIRGVAKPVTLVGEYTAPMKDPWGKRRAALAVSGKINRKDWGLAWNVALEAGGVMVSEEVKLRVEAQAVVADEAGAQAADAELAAAGA
ncbi:MAG: YceI family protein [Gemmatimonadota bacterium]|nr:YceI family protein [Gemmatimonadota bacterium]